MIKFSDLEKTLISTLSVAGGWDDKRAKSLKRKIKSYLLPKTSNCCCYCRRSMHQWHGLTIDVEHVLPKESYPKYTFNLTNLSVSCKRCNMGIKGRDVSFFLSAKDESNPFRSELYKIIHPNFDSINQHLIFFCVQHNEKLMMKYWVMRGSKKGGETYAYFKLKNVETNSFDEAQGLEAVVPSETLPDGFAQELGKVLEAIGYGSA